MTTTQKWTMLIAWLRRNFPTRARVRIRSIHNIKWQGEILFVGTNINTGIFKLTINRKQSFNLRVDALIHEWAHALTWFGAETHLDDHSSEWGITYARIYRTFIEWNWRKGSDDAL